MSQVDGKTLSPFVWKLHNAVSSSVECANLSLYRMLPSNTRALCNCPKCRASPAALPQPLLSSSLPASNASYPGFRRGRYSIECKTEEIFDADTLFRCNRTVDSTTCAAQRAQFYQI